MQQGPFHKEVSYKIFPLALARANFFLTAHEVQAAVEAMPMTWGAIQ